jgi:hypothetical protein
MVDIISLRCCSCYYICLEFCRIGAAVVVSPVVLQESSGMKGEAALVTQESACCLLQL